MTLTTTDQTGGAATIRRVLVVDDQRAFSELLALALDVQDDLECAGVALTKADALALVAEERPDVVLMDIHLPDGCGIEATRELKELCPDCDVLILTGRPDASLLARAADAGASGFLVKDHSLEVILTNLRRPRENTMRVEPATLAGLLQGDHRGDEAPRVSLTNRELTVLGLLGEGVAPKQVAYRLGISLHTARGYVKSILRKLDSHSVLEAVVTAQRLGLLPRPTSDDAV